MGGGGYILLRKTFEENFKTQLLKKHKTDNKVSLHTLFTEQYMCNEINPVDENNFMLNIL